MHLCEEPWDYAAKICNSVAAVDLYICNLQSGTCKNIINYNFESPRLHKLQLKYWFYSLEVTFNHTVEQITKNDDGPGEENIYSHRGLECM